MPTTPDPTTKAMNDEAAIYGALRQVLDPELGIDVVELCLLRKIDLAKTPAIIEMVLTTALCPYGPQLVHDVEEAASEGLGRDVKVKIVLTPPWDPVEAGLVW